MRTILLAVLIVVLLLAGCGAPKVTWTEDAVHNFIALDLTLMGFGLAALPGTNDPGAYTYAEQTMAEPMPSFMAVYRQSVYEAWQVCGLLRVGYDRGIADDCREKIDAANMEKARLIAEHGNPLESADEAP